MSAFAGVGLTGRQLWLAIAFVGAVSSALTAPVYLHFRGEVARIESACAERLDRIDSERRALSEMAIHKAELCAEQRLEHVEACAALRDMGAALLPPVEE
jgi:hypothetical protein